MPSADLPISVTELNRRARRVLEGEFPLTWVTGEVSNLARPGSGHIYFTLKDDAAQVRCAMFRSRAQLVPWKVENGDRIEAQGLVSLYESRGEFQLTVEAVRHAGQGRLFEAFLRLKAKLEAEGLFSPERKRPLPAYPRTIGIVTSLQAAALQDVLTALRRRAPHVSVVIYPSPVQGDEAPSSLGAALEAANRRRDCEVILLVRGGGSLEDLDAFNDEALARAIAAADIPVVSGIGHETDFTIADFVADLRGPTPTAAAELVTAGWNGAQARLAGLDASLRRSARRSLDRLRQRLDEFALRLVHPRTRLQRSADALRLLEQRLSAAARKRLDLARHRLVRCGDGLLHLNPTATLERGYAIVRDGRGHVLSAAAAAGIGNALSVQLARGQLHVSVTAVEATPD